MIALKKFVRDHVYLIVIVGLFGFLFFYHLDYTTLVSYDEAWYASIARTMAETGDWLHMTWYGRPFFDHPPMGIGLIALAFKLFGVTEFAARFFGALLGLGTLVVTYLTASEMFKKKVIGFAAALALGTSVWFVARARSGNLDTTFTFFYISTVYTALKAYKNPKWFVLSGISFGALIMTKTIVGISALPLLLYVSFPQWLKPKNLPYVLLGTFGWALIVLPWYTYHRATYPEFDHHHFKNIGNRNRTLDDYFEFSPAKQVLFYLHMGIRKWYKIWLVALAWITVRLAFNKKQRRNILFLLLWNAGILFPFLSSEQTEIWHLIPVYLPVVLIIAYALYDGLSFVLKHAQTYIPLPILKKKWLLPAVYIAGIACIALLQLKILWPEIIPEYRYTSDQVKIVKAAGKYDEKLYVDGDFVQMATFYSNKDARRIRDAAGDDPEYKNTLAGQFRTDEENFIVVTSWWAPGKLDDLGLEYEVYERINDFVIVGRPQNNETEE